MARARLIKRGSRAMLSGAERLESALARSRVQHLMGRSKENAIARRLMSSFAFDSWPATMTEIQQCHVCRRYYPVVTPATVDGDCLRETAPPPLFVLASSLLAKREFSPRPCLAPVSSTGSGPFVSPAWSAISIHSFPPPPSVKMSSPFLSLSLALLFSFFLFLARVYLSFPIQTWYISPVSSLHPAIPPLGTTDDRLHVPFLETR